ncbi:MAG: tRNA (adenosine(37)-N6)-threonylcarbamoyltransferase complex dimerization subunit type 1 TsaB [Halioglobus sp.]
MTGILAIETASDACSVAVYVEGVMAERHVIAPRQHSQLLFAMLDELLPGGRLSELGIQAIAYGCGPGSFTGLRIAASAVQGLAYSSNLPAIAVPTLSVLAQSALREGKTAAADTVFCTLDARINEVYSAVYGYEDGLAVLREGPWASAPANLAPRHAGAMVAVGNGCSLLAGFPRALRERLRVTGPELAPAARDIVPLALSKLQRGELQLPNEVQPVYVRDEISWKKLGQQGSCA